MIAAETPQELALAFIDNAPEVNVSGRALAVLKKERRFYRVSVAFSILAVACCVVAYLAYEWQNLPWIIGALLLIVALAVPGVYFGSRWRHFNNEYMLAIAHSWRRYQITGGEDGSLQLTLKN